MSQEDLYLPCTCPAQVSSSQAAQCKAVLSAAGLASKGVGEGTASCLVSAVVQDCIEMFSECCIPCLLLMMGATLAKGPGKACPPWRVVVGVCTARLVLMPLLGTGWILLAHKTGMVPGIWYSVGQYQPSLHTLIMLKTVCCTFICGRI